MAGSGNNQQFNPSFLTQNQQDLLMAALASNQSEKNNQFFAGQDLSGGAALDYSMATMDPSLFLSANADPSLVNFDMNGLNDQQFLAMMDSNENNMAFDSFLPDGQMMDDGADLGDLDDGDAGDFDLHDKRKSPEGDKEDGDPKRRESEEKSAKKPGRKPLTTEPTTKRKAQNRAAQRAFRERKEKHLKDLETKVGELEKSSESANHENALLRAHVQRLQVELREYRKRLSLNASLGRSPPLNGSLQSYLSNGSSATTTASNFQFEFPKFGGLPNLPFSGPTPPATASPATVNGVNGTRHNSADGRASPKSQTRGSLSSTGSPAKHNSIDATQTGNTPPFTNDVSNIFGTPSSIGDNSFDAGNGSETSANKQAGSETSGSDSRLFKFNATPSASPSASSISQYGQGPSSSCGTSPEPSHHSPATGNKDSTLDTINEHGYACHTTADGEISFCEKLNMACGNIQDPTPRAKSVSNESPAPVAAKASTTPGSVADNSKTSGVSGIDYFANQNGGQFDPVLFGDYRESNAAIIGDGDFTGGFFNDAMPSTDWGNTFNWNDLTGSMRTGLTPAVQKSNPLDQADFLVSGMEEDEVVPGEDTTKMLSCHKIWDVLQDRADFKSGDLDIDGLCSELRAKARCSESGVVIDQKDVDAALQRLPASRSNSSSNVAAQT